MIIIVILIQNLSYLINHYRKGYSVSFKGETSMTIVNINENNFEKEVVKSSLPCLVDFWAEWCGPCKNLAPILDEISNELKEKVFKFYIKTNQKIDFVFFLNVNKETIIKRIEQRKSIENRSDDDLNTIVRRYDKYMETTKPVLDFYSKNSNFYELDGSSKIEEITAKINGFINV